MSSVAPSTSNSILSNLSSDANAYAAKKEETEDALGREQFLTLLVAQLENQDPLNPDDSSEFTSQLAQYSSLEQLMNLNDTAEALAGAVEGSSGNGEATSYIGKTVTGNIDSMTVEKGSVSSGYYDLSESGDVLVDVFDKDGNQVNRLYLGQMEAGGHLISWDGTNFDDEGVDDGTYTYAVYANYGDGYKKVDTSITGTVDGVVYNEDTPYLVVDGILLSMDDITSVADLNSSNSGNAMDYLGRTVSTKAPIIMVDDSAVFGGGNLQFEVQDPDKAVTVNVYNSSDELVRSEKIDPSALEEGTNAWSWNGKSENGSQVDDGLYYYTVQTSSGDNLSTKVASEVLGIKHYGNNQYLVLENGMLTSLSSVDEIK